MNISLPESTASFQLGMRPIVLYMCVFQMSRVNGAPVLTYGDVLQVEHARRSGILAWHISLPGPAQVLHESAKLICGIFLWRVVWIFMNLICESISISLSALCL